MLRKKIFMFGLTVVVVTALVATLLGLIHHEPGFYRRSVIEADQKRKDLSMAFVGQFTRLAANFKDPENTLEEMTWTFSEAQINSFLAEDLIRLGDGEALKQRGITEPRLSIEKDRLRVAFRYSNALISTVFSIDMRLWLVPTQSNVIAVEILNHKLGAIPFSLQSIRDNISDLANKHNIEVTWYRHEGHPVALLRVQSKERPRAATKFNRLTLNPGGTLTVGLVSPEAVSANVPTTTHLTLTGN